ncbi:MAG: GntR family transcriptional regulator [Cypionkella sp.]
MSELLGLKAIATVPLHGLVYQRLIRALMAGQIPPGRELVSRKLAQELGASDMPVRAAAVPPRSPAWTRPSRRRG